MIGRAGIMLLIAAIAFLATAPLWAADFTVTLLDYIGIYALVALGLVLLTGVGGLTSFGQAAFVGIAAYATAWLTTVHGASPWLGLLICTRADRSYRGAAGCDHIAAWRTLSSARHDRLGFVDLLSVRQSGCARP